MHAFSFLLVLSSIGAHAVPLLHPRANDTLKGREVPYSIVNVGDESGTSLTPALETVTVVHPPPPVTLTVTQTRSAIPSSSGFVVPPAWSIGPIPTGTPGGKPEINPRGFNTSKRSSPNLKRSTVANSTEPRSLAARSNGTETSNLHARSNATSHGLGARSNMVASLLRGRSDKNGTTTTKLSARSNGSETRTLLARGDSTNHGRSLNSTLPV
ncbi:hypothetical protein EYZ11_001549 [Aspergillus tanneri]|uniref:Uncharacterized protein n=1 Tax=Aspergillus tanneri TaxID=1220188 RepID=A0A4S3JUE2_9EURO|nr:uncharacterized protein ATNIH1004_007582 [Aspergillus tanneri]KAA8646156.1 hypothetical protein ATNIH1004_007582 [Aspergillus tanneri]THC98998.1 hypothetical protein EYZ11_001549 [Aspergillus tanneri]